MFTITGKHNSAVIYTDNADNETQSQLINLLNQEFVSDSKIAIMPDTHAGAGCVIGTTMTIHTKIVPNLVGVDIGCGMLVINLGKVDLDLPELDNFIRNNIPHGFHINNNAKVNFKNEINQLRCLHELSKETNTFNRALGSLGGGNHFIELNKDSEGRTVLVIHSGSRNMGLQIANYYQKIAVNYHNGLDNNFHVASQELIKTYKATGKKKEIQGALKTLRQQYARPSIANIPDDLCYLEGQHMQDYLHDAEIAQEYAYLNRETMGRAILDFLGMDFDSLAHFQTIHNYIDMHNMILRKGAVSAQKGELLIIPINMRDGSIIAIGKGNGDWNYSAPHGAGRLMSRNKAKSTIALTDFKAAMSGIYSTSVVESTLDESPFAYKPMREIINNIQDTVEIVDIIKPIYNFKAS